jgi:hypothetical protein
MVALQEEPEDLRGALSAPRFVDVAQHADDGSLSHRFNPAAAWPGHPSLRPWLFELWRQYGPLALDRRVGETVVGCTLVEHWLQEALQEFHPRLDHLHIHLVRYPGLLVYPVPPHALILGLDQDLKDHTELWTAVHDATALLAAI